MLPLLCLSSIQLRLLKEVRKQSAIMKLFYLSLRYGLLAPVRGSDGGGFQPAAEQIHQLPLRQNGQDSRATEKEWLSAEELRWRSLFQRHDGHAIPSFHPLTGTE